MSTARITDPVTILTAQAANKSNGSSIDISHATAVTFQCVPSGATTLDVNVYVSLDGTNWALWINPASFSASTSTQIGYGTNQGYKYMRVDVAGYSAGSVTVQYSLVK